MMRLLLALGLACLASLAPSIVYAQTEVYEFNVRRVERNVYWDRSQRIVLMTRSCSEYASGDDVQVIIRGATAIVLFQSGETCDLARASRPNAYVRRIADNVYANDLGGGIIRTSMCLDLTLGEHALVTSDRLIFLDSRNSCPLEW
jgi:hypothetical protein